MALPQKHVIMQEAGGAKAPPAWTNMTFRPQLDPVSEQLAQRDRGNLVDRLYTKKKEYEIKVWLKQQEKEQQALQGCTFQPNSARSPTASTSSKNRGGSRSNERACKRSLAQFESQQPA